MVAQASTEKLARAILTPAPDPTDSDDVATALETARALEAQGEMAEAARWLRRAADEAEKEGNDRRIVIFARAAADLASPISGSMPRSVQPPPPKPAPWSVPVSSRPGTQVTPPPPPPARTSTPPLPPRASAPPGASRTSALPPASARPSAPPRPAGFRVSVEHSATDARLFVVRRLEPHEQLPTGAVEARLVFTGPEPT